MSDKVQQNQTPPNHNIGMNNWSQQWQNLSNNYAQPRPFTYWPQWSAHYSMNLPQGGGLLPHPSIPFPPMQIQNFNYPPQINSSNNSFHNCSGNNNSINNTDNSGFSSLNLGNLSVKNNPPLPKGNSENKIEKNEETTKSVENPDKIPLPDGPPPSNKSFPPLPSVNASNINSSRPFFNANTPPIKFNLKQQNKPFTPFSLPNRKNKRKKNKNQQSGAFGSVFNKANMSMSVNFTPARSSGDNLQNPPLPPLPPNPASHIIDSKDITEQNNPSIETFNDKEVSPVQNQQPTHEDWPQSLLEYIKRCYLKCESSIDKDQVGIILKGKITSAMSSNTLFQKNWDLEPLPDLRGNKCEQSQPNAGGTNINNISFKERNKINISLKSRLGKNRNYRGNSKRSTSGSPPSRNYRSRSRSKSRSRTRSRSRSRSRSNTPNPKRKHKNSNSNSSDDNRIVNPKMKSEKKSSKKSKRKQKKQGAFFSDIAFGETESASIERLQQRAARFKETLEAPKNSKKPIVIASSVIAYEDTEGDFDYNDLHIVGTCQELEKPFLRLTSAPDASQVRPSDVLEKSLELIKAKWIENSDYRYTCEQLKSIRQDLTVQGIRNDFTVKVYETHARICLEKGDPEEFNQCQTQLRMLYADLGGANKYEFTAYRILYYIYTKNTLDLTISIGSLDAEAKEHECVNHALQIAHAWCMNNYHRFFWLYQLSPKMSSYLIDWFIERERKSALKTMIKAYRQSLPVIFVAEKLGFDSVEKFLEFATTFNLAYSDVERSKIDCKASVASLNNF